MFADYFVVLEDYVHLSSLLLYHAPEVFFHPQTFELCFKVSVPVLGVVYNGIVAVALDLFRDILSFEDPIANTPYTRLIESVFLKEGVPLISAVLEGVVGDFYEEKTGAVVSIIRSAVVRWPTEVMGALPAIMQSIPTSKASSEAKAQFITEMTRLGSSFLTLIAVLTFAFFLHSVVKSGHFDKVRYAILTLRRATRKARDRRQDFS